MFKHSISLKDAETIADVALKTGVDKGFQPLTVVVLDDGGHIKVLKRSDGSSVMRQDIALGKAYGVIGMGMGGRELKRRSEKMGPFMNALSDLADGRAVPVPGGVLIRDADGLIVGSVGITGDLSENDELCAVAGIEAAGLKPDTGDPA